MKWAAAPKLAARLVEKEIAEVKLTEPVHLPMMGPVEMTKAAMHPVAERKADSSFEADRA